MESCGMGPNQKPYIRRSADYKRAKHARVSFRVPISKLKPWLTNADYFKSIDFHTLLKRFIGSCRYKKFPDNYVATNEGIATGDHYQKSEQECKQLCDGDTTCNSFSLCKNVVFLENCYLKGKSLDGSETSKYKSGCTTYYQYCGKKFYKFCLTIPSLPIIYLHLLINHLLVNFFLAELHTSPNVPNTERRSTPTLFTVVDKGMAYND